MFAIGERYYNLYEKYGAFNWAMWRKNNWGAEHNPYNSIIEKEDDDTIFMSFVTANYGVPNIVKKLTEMFPNLWFEYKYADEDIACNCGEGGSNTEHGFVFNVHEDESDEALRVFLECWGEDNENVYKDDNGHYRYVDFEDEVDE